MAPKRVAKGTGLISESASLSVAARIAEIERKRKITNGPEPRQAQGSTSIWRAAPKFTPGELSASSTTLVTSITDTTPRIPLRSDHASIRNSRRGGVDKAIRALEARGLETLVTELQTGRDAATGTGNRQSHINTWTEFHRRIFGPILPVLPITTKKLIPIGALFKAGDFRSFPNYLTSIKSYHLDEGHSWGEVLAHTTTWVSRSVSRGIGPPRQSAPLPMTKVIALSRGYQPVVEDGPCNPQATFLLAAIFLLREVEMTATRLAHLTFDAEQCTITWLLSSSKTDPEAHGVERSWGCLCGSPQLPCPYHIGLLIFDSANKYADRCHLSSEERKYLPLFHNLEGTSPSKQAMVSTFEYLAVSCGLDVMSCDGQRKFGGHSARVTGAQSLAACGIPVDKIRILARHSGDAVLRYVKDAPLKSLQADLGLSTAFINPKTCKQLRMLTERVNDLTTKVQAQAEEMQAMISISCKKDHICYVQNLFNSKIHGMRPGDATTTACGWKVGPAKVKRGQVRFLSSITSESWQTLCSRCLAPERAAAKQLASREELECILSE